jgi:hypothetical protein
MLISNSLITASQDYLGGPDRLRWSKERDLRILTLTYPTAPATTMNIMILHIGSACLGVNMMCGKIMIAATRVMTIDTLILNE